MSVSTPVRLVFDLETRRPMCVLIQALYTADYITVNRFNAESWLTTPTDKMALFELMPEQLEKVVKTMNARFPMKQRGRHAKSTVTTTSDDKSATLARKQ